MGTEQTTTIQIGEQMTRKDFELIARTLLSVRPLLPRGKAYPQWRETVQVFSSELASTNPQFDKSRFETACGLDDTPPPPKPRR